MKRFFALFALIILAVTPLCLVGCKSKYDNLAIEMEDSFSIVLGQDENDSITVQARVTGASDDNGGKLSFSPDNDKLVRISQEYKNGINYITLKALAPGKVNIEARTLEGGVTKNFVVDIIQPINNFTVKSGNFVVVRGGQWKIDVEKNLNLEPTNTTQTNFAVSFAANQDIAGLNIQDNILTVSETFAKEEVVLSVVSTDNPEIAPKEIKLTVLDEFVEIDKQTQANQSRFSSGDILVFEKNESMLSYGKLEEINIVSNLLSESERDIVVRVYSTKEVDVSAVSNSRLSVKKVSVLDNLDTSGKLQYTDFVFSVRFADIVSSGTITNLDFVVKYADFDLSTQLSSIKVAYELAPKTLLINDQDDLDEFTLYNFYSTAKKGQKLQFGVLPTSVSSTNSKMVLLNKNNLTNSFDYLQFFRSNGEELFEGDEINANETIYARAKSGVNTGSFEVVLQTKFVNPQTNAPLSKVLKFNVLAGITEINFVDDEQINLQLNSSTNSANVLFEVKPANVDLTKIHVEDVDGLNSSTIAMTAQSLEGKTFKFVVTAQKVGTYKIKVYSENGFEITKEVKVINALEDVVLSAPSPNDNSVVGDRQIIGGELHYVAVSLGGAINLGQTISPEDAKYRVEYSYFETTSMPEFALSSYDYPNSVSSTSMGVLDYSQLMGYGKIVSLKEGWTVIRAKYVPIGIVDNVESELEPIYKFFIVQSYKPIRSVIMSSNYETLYSLTSVGVYNKHLTMTKVSLSVQPSDATYAQSIDWSYDNSGEYFDFDEETLTISAKKSYAGTISIIATIRELNRTYTQTLSVTILDAKTVSKISVVGIGDSLYIENVDDGDKIYRINASAFPTDAYNTKLRYDFVDQAGNVISEIKISTDGEMVIPNGVGMNGFIRIASEDCFQENQTTGEYQPSGIEGQNIILIPTIIANGTSKETAIRINSKEELQNIDTKKHYKIYGDIDVSGISFESFSGGLYGADPDSRIVLSGFDRTFIQTLTSTGRIEDLEIDCDASLTGDNGVLVGKNEGYINNLVIKGNWTGALSLVKNNAGKIYNVICDVNFDGEKFAGIAGVNNGEIYNCMFRGSIIASNQAAGIALSNAGLIDQCATLLVEQSEIKLSATFEEQARIAGLCVENAANGTILRSYIHSYKTDAAFSPSDFANVSAFVYTNNGTIQKCFSALNDGDAVVGFVYMNNSNATVENCYSNTTFAVSNVGKIQKCFSVNDDEILNSSTDCYSGLDATSKTVSDWLETNWDISCTYEKTTIWKVYLDSQNPFLSEVSAEVAPETVVVSVNEPKSTNSYIKINDNQVVLYRYESQVSPLSVAEKAKLNNLNSIAIYDLLTFDVYPYSASSAPEAFRFTLSDGDALAISGNNIIVLGLGKQTLTITSIYNQEISYSLDIYTSYPIRDFNIFASTSSIDPSAALTNDTTIYLKRSYTQPLYAKVVNSIVLVDREIEFKTFDLKMSYSNADQAVAMGLYILYFDTKQEIDDFACALDFSGISTYAEFEEIKFTLSALFSRVFDVVVYNGAESLLASQYSFEMEPIDSIELEISLKTDLTDCVGEDGKLITDKKVIKYEIYSKLGVNFTDEYFDISYQNTALDTSEYDKTGFITIKVTLGIRMKEATTQVSGDYYVRVYPNETENTTFTLSPIEISLKLLPQSIQRIDYSHYYADTTVQNNIEVLKTNITPSNALAPGQVGLLEINLFPTYSEISHVEVESIPNEGQTVRLQLYQKRNIAVANEFVMAPQDLDYDRTENGIIVGYTMITDGTIYVKTQVSSNIPEELTFELVIRAYKTKDDLNPVVQHVYLAAKFIPSATIEIDGQKDYVVMGRGTTKDMTITVIGEGDVEISVNDNTSGTTYSYQRVYAGQKTLVETTNLGTQNKYVWTCPLVVGALFSNDKSDVATITVVVSREVNGVREKKETLLTIRVLDFVVNNVVLTNGTNQYSSKVSVKTLFDFSFDITEPQAFTNEDDDIKAVKDLKTKIENFKKAQYFTSITNGTNDAYTYEKSFMFVDSLGDHLAAIKNADGYAFDQNEYVQFEIVKNGDAYAYTIVTGLKTGTQKMKLKVASTNANNNSEVYSITYEFDIVVTNYSNEDKPMPVGSLEDFNAIFEQSDAQDYILTSDIEIYDHVIYSDTSKIRSLDGNNHKIIIKSLDLGENQTLDVALFDTISETTTIKNLIVDYQIGEINANSDQFSSINVAGLALDNNGIVTNTHVLSTKGTSTQTKGGLQISSSVGQSTQIQMAGFVLNNSGSITNSRVGDTSVTIVDKNGGRSEETLKVFALVGQDQMAGFVLNNSGIISASYAKNITIVNNSKFSSNNQTAGFVLNNQSNAKIAGCYVRGVESSNQSEVYVLGEGIESSFEVAGFVYNNLSYIIDCYSNIKLYKETATENRTGTRSAGFVYKNEIGAQVISSLSLSKIVEDDTSQEQFCGVDSENQSNNKGTIIYSYYYSQKGKVQSVADGAELLDASGVNQQDKYYGYAFTNMGSLDGMWYMTSRGPELVSANNIALSKRYLISTEEDKYEVAYVANYEYGSFYNPILIRSATEFNEVFGTSKDDSIKNYLDTSKKQAFGNYRIINDIDLSDLSYGGDETTTLSSTSFTFTRKTDEFGGIIGYGILEGNSMTISNLDFSITDTDQTYFGLFAAITNEAIVKNLNLTVKEISASSVNYVGSLAGYVEDSKIINVTAEIAQGQQVALVQGRNIVGGVVGVVSGTSELNNISSSVSAHANYVDLKTDKINEVNKNGEVCVQVAIPTLPSEGSGHNAIVSIAGSVAGAVYAKDTNNPDNNSLSTIEHAQVQKIKASGKISVSAKIAGGLIGYVGKTTYVHDAWLAISDGQSITAHDYGVAGGAVGLSYGKLSHIRIEHNDVQDYTDEAENDQTEIEDNVADYYNGKANERKTYENMFTSSNIGQTLGGIVGIMNGGVLEDSYTKLDVISDTAYNLGGIVGIIKNQKYEISRVYTFSNVQSKSTEKNVLVGGLFGAVLSSGELDIVVGANYLDKNYTTKDGAKEKYVAFAPFAGACTYIPKMENVYTLSAIWDSAKDEQNIANNTGADINNKKTVLTLQTTLKNLFPAQTNAAEVNDVFEIGDEHFKNEFWARNVDDVLPHLTFGLEEQFFIIDSINTAGDIRKMLKNSNKIFYIDGRVNLTSAECILAIKEVRESIIFTGSLLGMPESMNPSDPDETPTLIGLQELFNSAVGATFADFNIEQPQYTSTTLPTQNGGGLVGDAKDCQFRNITIGDTVNNISLEGNFSNLTLTDKNFGALVGLSQGKTSFEHIAVQNINIITYGEANVGIIVGKSTSSVGGAIFKDCQITNCNISAGSSSSENKNVGGFVGLANNGVTITSNNSTSSIQKVKINVNAQYVGGIVGKCLGEATIRSIAISSIAIGKPASLTKATQAIAVGGVVGQAENLSMTANSDIILTDEADDSYGKIEVDSSEGNVYVGGIVGNVESSFTLSNIASQYIKLQTNDMSVKATHSAANVFAGGIVGNVGNINIDGFKVNTQGEIKNKVLAILCKGSTFAGGLVGKAGNVQISDCWSGTDVEVSDVTKSTKADNGSCVTFGGIVGEVTNATTSTAISGNVSYGRFYLNADCNINTINAGGVVGSITCGKNEQQSLTAITSNKTLTSLEIRRQATNHNVNAVVGSRNNVITGSEKARNAYTYQLSLAVESDTSFAKNYDSYSNLLTDNTKNLTNIQSGEQGSILNPQEISSDENIVEGYYSLANSSAITLTFPTWSESEEENFVLIGNGNSIKNTHINTIGSRTILSGVTVEGVFDYDVSGGENAKVTLGGVTYGYSTSKLTNGTEDYPFATKTILDWKPVTATSSATTKYYYVDDSSSKIYIEIDETNKEQINGELYYIAGNLAIKEDKSLIYNYSQTTTYSCTINGETQTFEESDIENVEEDGAEYSHITLGGVVYVVDEEDGGLYLTEKSKTDKIYLTETVQSSISESKELKSTVVNEVTLSFGGNQIVETELSKTIDGASYKIVLIDSEQYVINDEKTKVSPLSTQTIVTIKGTTYVVDGKQFFKNGTLVGTATGGQTYEQSQGFVTENNGYISGVVVKCNYSYNSEFGGFVTTNNGTILYSSMNGQIYSQNNNNVAGFVLENNGIVDYCHSTGAVQGNAQNSYSFGVNSSDKNDAPKTGSLTNSYTIMLNETSGTKSVFANNGGTFSKNEYDPVGTEIEQNLVGLSNGLTGVSTDNDATSGYWMTTKIKSPTTEKKETKYHTSYNYGYKTLSAGPFNGIEYLSITTGDGSKGDPFIIANSRMLSKIDTIGTSCSYKLANNIDLSKNSATSSNWGNIGLAQAYSGTFDGTNKTISNLTYKNYSGEYTNPTGISTTNRPDNSVVVGGLFAKTGNNSIIKDLTLEGETINIATQCNTTNSRCAYAGGLIGHASGKTTIENVTIKNMSVKVYANTKAYAGGMIGYASGSKITISNSRTVGNVYAENTFNKTTLVGGYSSIWTGFSDPDTAKEYQSSAGKAIGYSSANFSQTNNNFNASSKAKVQPVYVLNTNLSSSYVSQKGLLAYAGKVVMPTSGNETFEGKLDINDFVPSGFHVDSAFASIGTNADEYMTIGSSKVKDRYSASVSTNNSDCPTQTAYEQYSYEIATSAYLECTYKKDKHDKTGNGTTRLHVWYYNHAKAGIADGQYWTGAWNLNTGKEGKTKLNYKFSLETDKNSATGGEESVWEETLLGAASKDRYGTDRNFIVYQNSSHVVGIPATFLKPTITATNGKQYSPYSLTIKHKYKWGISPRDIHEKVSSNGITIYEYNYSKNM